MDYFNDYLYLTETLVKIPGVWLFAAEERKLGMSSWDAGEPNMPMVVNGCTAAENTMGTA